MHRLCAGRHQRGVQVQEAHDPGPQRSQVRGLDLINI